MGLYGLLIPVVQTMMVRLLLEAIHTMGMQDSDLKILARLMLAKIGQTSGLGFGLERR
jgi:aspartyl/asparaginyl-tRNA synthetase